MGMITLQHPLVREWFWFMVPAEVIDRDYGSFSFTLVIHEKAWMCFCKVVWAYDEPLFQWRYCKVVRFEPVKLSRQQRKELSGIGKFRFFGDGATHPSGPTVH
jgi:hypothetical protein